MDYNIYACLFATNADMKYKHTHTHAYTCTHKTMDSTQTTDIYSEQN